MPPERGRVASARWRTPSHCLCISACCRASPASLAVQEASAPVPSAKPNPVQSRSGASGPTVADAPPAPCGAQAAISRRPSTIAVGLITAVARNFLLILSSTNGSHLALGSTEGGACQHLLGGPGVGRAPAGRTEA